MNNRDITDYQSLLVSRENFLILNDQALIDNDNSYSTAFVGDEKVIGDRKGSDFVNWGLAKSVVPSECSYENFWNTSTSQIARSSRVIGLASTLHTAELSLENFQKTRASILGQYTIVFKDEETTSRFFAAISANLKLCATGVVGRDLQGNPFEIFKEGPKKNFNFYSSGSDVLLRTGFDELLILDFFIKTRFSISLIKVFANDLNLPDFGSWNVFEPVIQLSINQICALEECDPSIISLGALSKYAPSPSLEELPKLD